MTTTMSEVKMRNSKIINKGVTPYLADITLTYTPLLAWRADTAVFASSDLPVKN